MHQKKNNYLWGWVWRLRRKAATLGVVGVVCMIGYGAIFGADGFLVFRRKVKDSRQLDRQIQALQQDNARRQQQIQALKTQPQAIEKEARQRLRYARPGEVVYMLPSSNPMPPDKNGN